MSATDKAELRNARDGTDVIDLLLAQHGQIKNALEAVLSAESDKQRCFDDLVRLLAVHEQAEEAVVHPAARRHSVPGAIVDSRLREESDIEQMLARLADLGVHNAEFDTTFRAFADRVVEHAELEEKEEFGPLLTQVTPAERVRLAGLVRLAEATPIRMYSEKSEGR